MNGYVNGNAAYKYEQERGSAARDKRWQTHQAIRQQLHIVEINAAERRREAARARFRQVTAMVLSLISAVLLLIPVTMGIFTALDTLCRSGFSGGGAELAMVLGGAALTGVLLYVVCKQAEATLDTLSGGEEDAVPPERR